MSRIIGADGFPHVSPQHRDILTNGTTKLISYTEQLTLWQVYKCHLLAHLRRKLLFTFVFLASSWQLLVLKLTFLVKVNCVRLFECTDAVLHFCVNEENVLLRIRLDKPLFYSRLLQFLKTYVTDIKYMKKILLTYFLTFQVTLIFFFNPCVCTRISVCKSHLSSSTKKIKWIIR